MRELLEVLGRLVTTVELLAQEVRELKEQQSQQMQQAMFASIMQEVQEQHAREFHGGGIWTPGGVE